MATSINITLPEHVSLFLDEQVKTRKVSLSKVISDLIESQITEDEEDRMYLELAKVREESPDGYYSRDEVKRLYGV